MIYLECSTGNGLMSSYTEHKQVELLSMYLNFEISFE